MASGLDEGTGASRSTRPARRFARWRSRRPVHRTLPAHLEGVGGAKLVRRVRRQLMAAATVANTLGVVLVIVCIVWVLPGPPIDVTTELVVANSIVAAVFLFVVCPIGVVWGETWLRSGRRWLQEGRPPSESEVIAVLRAPFRLFLVHATSWLLGAFAFALTNALLAVSPNLTLAAVAVVTTGVAASLFVTASTALLQRHCAPAMRGRVMALAAMVLVGGLPIGGPIVGMIVDHVGPRAGVMVGSVAALLVAAVALRHQPPGDQTPRQFHANLTERVCLATAARPT